MRSFFPFLILCLLHYPLFSQKTDTVRISAKDINTSVLHDGTHRYLVYFQRGKGSPRSMTEFWSRDISRKEYNGKMAIEVIQTWESRDTIIHTTKSFCDATTLRPFYHEFWWNSNRMNPKPSATVVNFETNSVAVDGKELSDTVADPRQKKVFAFFKGAQDQYLLNWHLDLEVFPTLPYKEGRTFIVPFYDPGTGSGLTNAIYTVTGSSFLDGTDNQKIDCWVLKLEEKGNKEIFYVSKKTREVLKLVQEINGSLYRYKLKLFCSE